MAASKVQLSKNFTLGEFTRSSKAQELGLMNTPSPEHEENLREFCLRLLQPLRDRFGPVYILSGYRSQEVNEAVGGSPTSAHAHGLGVDLRLAYATPKLAMEWLAYGKDAPHFFDQAILYPSHIHLGYKRPSTGEQRRQFLKTRDGKTFKPWLKELT